MRKISILSSLALAFFVAGCANTQPNTSKVASSDYKLKTDRDYIVEVARGHQLHIIDGKEDKLVKTCKLQGGIVSGGLIISPNGREAYVLQDSFQSIYGYDLDSCENNFRAKLSTGNIRAMSIMSFNISNDGKKLYTISNPTEMLNDRYKVLDPVFKTFNTDGGLEATAIDSFNVPRQITVMATAKDGTLYASGPEVYNINPKTHEVKVLAKHRAWGRKNYSDPDVLALWPVQNASNEFLLMYTAAKFKDKTQNLDTADYVWGATRVDLDTGKIEQEDFAPLESVMFTGMTDPNNSNILYGVLTDLTKFDRENRKVIKRVYLDHSYYCINFSTDGSKIYLGGTFNDIAVYDPKTLEKITNIKLPKGDTAVSTLQVFRVK